MNFTIFTPTRGRPQLVGELLKKINENTKDLSKIQVLFYVDEDDKETIDFLKSELYFNSVGEGKIELSAFIRPRPSSLNEAINYLASQAKSQYLFNINDDCQIITKDWDEIILNKIAAFKTQNNIKDDIIYCKTGDNSIDRDASKGYCSFPIISRQAVDAIGLFMYPQFVGLGGDSSIFRVYNELNRVVDCSEIQLDHVYHSSLFAVMAPDKTAAEMRANTAKAYVDPYTFDVSKEVEKLKQFINNYGRS